MDSSKNHFSTEGCSSSESGWTMYIDSPMQEDDDDDDHHYRNSNKYTSVNDDREDNKEESDDSMASDASSGPSHHQYPRANGEGQGIRSNIPSTSKQGKVDQFRKFFSFKKSNEKEKKSGETSTKYKHRNDPPKKYK
ncbi:hypothetical protein Patl1_21567 [Pistacia atlantica]|uniref:Uncharacterized protein n=1 Tax=Pistacia atlantica TaxID=434234 RepID=A0ACC1BIU8_9ROSI|nr:hypothetical protein Patl1_21567 [Pistacia atlantica]